MSFPPAFTSLPPGVVPGSHVVDQAAWDGMRTYLATDNGNRNAGGFNYSSIRDLTFRRQFSIAGGELARNNASYNFLTQAQGTSATPIQFAVTSPGGTMTTAVSVTVTLTPVPPGVNGTDAHHHVRVSGGTGAAESVLITGGTAVSGAASGTLIFTPANSHSGAWKLGSATSGIQEAVVECGSIGRVKVLEGDWPLYAGVWVGGANKISIRGEAQYVTFCRTMGTTGDWFTYDTGSSSGVDFGSLSIVDDAGTYHTSGSMLKIINRPFGCVSDLYIDRAYDGITNDTGQNAFFSGIFVRCSHLGLLVTSTTQSTGSYSQILVVTDDTGLGRTAVAFKVLGPTAGMTFSQCGCGAVSGTGARGLQIVQNSNGASNELNFSNCIFDGHQYSADIVGYGTYVNNRIQFDNCGFNAILRGLSCTGSISGLRMSNCTAYGDDAGLYLSDVKNSQFTGNAFNAITAAVNTAGVITDSQFIGNSVGVDNVPSYGFAFGGTQSGVVLDNKLVRGSLANYLFSSLTGLIWDGDTADDIQYPYITQPSVASATTTTFPYNKYFILSGNTPITTIAGVWPGRNGMFRCTHATPPAISSGGGNIFTPTQNVMVRFHVDILGRVWTN